MSATLTITFPSFKQASVSSQYLIDNFDAFEVHIEYSDTPIPEEVTERSRSRARMRMQELERALKEGA